jgi:hypothetical protein
VIGRCEQGRIRRSARRDPDAACGKVVLAGEEPNKLTYWSCFAMAGAWEWKALLDTTETTKATEMMDSDY